MYGKLTEGLTEEEFAPYVQSQQRFRAGEVILRAGDPAKDGFGVVAEGAVLVFKEDWFGNREILNLCKEGETFLEAVSFGTPDASPVTVTAQTDCSIVFLDYRRLLLPASSCRVHARLLENLLRILADKALALNGRISVLSGRSIREKVLRYLRERSHGTRECTVPFDRTQLADYLCVDRSALSRELSAMRDRGEIEFRRNRFRILAPEEPGS